ncbi:MAG TPA: DUF4838 domain-containing protein [Armatimonadetes bacterium]|nr:DUF4838 domain-containing protein [Armatimonadota bacterium]
MITCTMLCLTLVRCMLMRYARGMAVIMAFSLMGGVLPQLEKLPLIESGKARCCIVLPSPASDSLMYTARELQTYLYKMTGVTVPIRKVAEAIDGLPIYVGDLARLPNAPIKGLDAEEFVIEVNPRAIWLYGGSEAGAYFAVVTFLEHCGVRWLMPGKLGEFVPRKNKLTVAHMRIREKPGFVYRTVWYAYGGRPRHERLEYERWKRRNKMGGRHISMGHNLYSIYPPRRFAEDHPEYYPLINGRRAIPQTNAGWQPCTSNPEVVQIAIETARHHFDSHPDAWTYSLSPNDGYGWCECERCRIQDPPQFKDDPHRGKGRRMLIFANAVARALQESHPGK